MNKQILVLQSTTMPAGQETQGVTAQDIVEHKRLLQINVHCPKSLFSSSCRAERWDWIRRTQNLFTIIPIFYLLLSTTECLSCDLLFQAVFRNHHRYTLTVMNKTFHSIFFIASSFGLAFFGETKSSRRILSALSDKKMGKMTLFEYGNFFPFLGRFLWVMMYTFHFILLTWSPLNKHNLVQWLPFMNFQALKGIQKSGEMVEIESRELFVFV